MKLFISWSGHRSNAVAKALKTWIPDVLQHVEVWMSEHDIEAGARWNAELDKILETCNFGILCLTPDNQNTPWLLFEAGALAKASKIAKVIPYRIGLSASDIQYPLAQFQGVNADKDGTLQLLRSVNETCEPRLSSELLERVFQKWWPDLESKLNSLPSAERASVPRRSERELLEEILSLLRTSQPMSTDQQLEQRPPLARSRKAQDWRTARNIYVDTSQLMGKGGKQFDFSMTPDELVSDFLDRLYFALNSFHSVKAHTYGVAWLLEGSSGKRYDDIGRKYSQSKGHSRDNRTLSEVGILGEGLLRVVRP